MPMEQSTRLIERLRAAPILHDGQQAARVLADLALRAQQDASLAPLLAMIDRQPVRDLLAGIFGASSFLTALIEREPGRLCSALAAAPEERFDELCRAASAAVAAAASMTEAMRSCASSRTRSRFSSRCATWATCGRS